jgi:hypothetical protein
MSNNIVPYAVGQKLTYVKNGVEKDAEIRAVHYDDAPNVYYTIVTDNGNTEKQTDHANLKEVAVAAPPPQYNSNAAPNGVGLDISKIRISVWDAARVASLNPTGRRQFAADLDELGARSGIAQNLNGPITTADKLMQNPRDHQLIVANNSNGEMLGYLKYGYKDLFFYNKKGKVLEFPGCVCLLDFYVSQTLQRQGVGITLFKTFLSLLAEERKGQNCGPEHIAYDRPSPKLLSFMKKHFNLRKPNLQPNRYTIFEGFPLPK